MAVNFTAIKPNTYMATVFISQNLKCYGCPYNLEEGAFCRNYSNICIQDPKINCCRGQDE